MPAPLVRPATDQEQIVPVAGPLRAIEAAIEVGQRKPVAGQHIKCPGIGGAPVRGVPCALIDRPTTNDNEITIVPDTIAKGCPGERQVGAIGPTVGGWIIDLQAVQHDVAARKAASDIDLATNDGCGCVGAALAHRCSLRPTVFRWIIDVKKIAVAAISQLTSNDIQQPTMGYCRSIGQGHRHRCCQRPCIAAGGVDLE